MKIAYAVPVLLGSLALTACGGSDSNDTESKGRVSVSLTDAPVDSAEHVFIEFTGVTLVPAGADGGDDADEGEDTADSGADNADAGQDNAGDGETGGDAGATDDEEGDGPNFVSFTFAEPRTIDLLALQGGNRDFLVDDEEVPAGDYAQIRLHVNAELDGEFDSYIVLDDGAEHELFVPSGSQSGLKLVHDFQIGADVPVEYTIDFDLRRSIVHAGNSGRYHLKPVLRLIETEKSGEISGIIDPVVFDGVTCSGEGEGEAAVDPQDSYAIYVYTGSNVEPDDLGSGTEAVTTTGVSLNEASQYEYTAAFLDAGEYTVAATCQADADAPEADDDIDFVGSTNVSVSPGQTTPHDFTGAPASDEGA